MSRFIVQLCDVYILKCSVEELFSVVLMSSIGIYSCD